VSRSTLFKDLGLKWAPSYSFLLHVKFRIQIDKSQEDSFLAKWARLKNYRHHILQVCIVLLINTASSNLNSYENHKIASVKSYSKFSSRRGCQIKLKCSKSSSINCLVNCSWIIRFTLFLLNVVSIYPWLKFCSNKASWQGCQYQFKIVSLQKFQKDRQPGGGSKSILAFMFPFQI